ncbi:hypothetical protein C0993_008339 [Termitomyces sp. T159_Od127]|nr:hypothetical protein C0993_008339 [Termitomyces sp. T159_Od127]
MDHKDAPRPRRPLPTPGAPPAQRPNTPVPAVQDSPVAPSSFYGKSPPLPTRPQPIGSSHTTYVSPNDPPPFRSPSVTAFREPELVVEEPTESLSAANNGWQALSWDTPAPAATAWQNDSWENTNKLGSDGWPTGRDNFEDYDPMAFMTAAKSHVDIAIGGRDDYEEKHWWDPALRSKETRPGPGMIPTMLADELHDADHSLFSVLVSNPDAKPLLVPPADPPSDQASSTSNAWASAQPSPSCPPATSTTAPPPPPPTDSDVRTAVPHPNAYYCPKENGWVILSWKSSSVSPPYATSFKESRHPPLPDQERRRRYVSCLDNGPYPLVNKTHHFHKYEKAIDSHKLTPPLRMEEWELTESVKQKRRAGIIDDDIDVKQLDEGGYDCYCGGAR